MKGFWSAALRPSLRERLGRVIRQCHPEVNGSLTDTTSLIRSGLVDSLGLLTIAVFIEREIGRAVDITSFDLVRRWDTIADILSFIEQLR